MGPLQRNEPSFYYKWRAALLALLLLAALGASLLAYRAQRQQQARARERDCEFRGKLRALQATRKRNAKKVCATYKDPCCLL